MFLKQPMLWVSLATILAVTACGSGGGGSDNSAPPGTNPPITNPGGGDDSAVTLSGAATKGVLKGAQVTAYELDDSGNRLTDAVGSTQTKADGSYELELTEAYSGGLIEVEVSVIAGTKMVCDAVKCGNAAQAEEIDLPADFTLTAIVKKPSTSSTVTASVTAWSTMAAKRTKAIVAADSSKSLDDATKQANAEVSQIVGFDIAKTTSKGLSQIEGSTAVQAQYAVMNAAVAEVLFAGSDGSDLTTRLASFTSALDDGIVGGESDSLKLADLSNAVRDVASRVTLDASAIEAINNQSSQYDAAGDDGLRPEYDDELAVDDDATQAEKIEKFQAFVVQARTWISKLQEFDVEGLTAAVDVDAASVEAILASNEDFAFVGLALDEVNNFIVENAASIQGYIDNGAEESIVITDDQGGEIGTATLTFANEDGLKIAIAGLVSGETAETYKPFSLMLDTNLPIDAVMATAEEDEGGAYVELGVAKLMASTTMTLSGYVGNGQENPLTLNEITVNLELDQAIDSVAEEVLNNHFKAADLAGEVTIAKEGVTFVGAVELKIVKLISGFNITGLDTSPISFKYFRVTGDFDSDNGHSFSASAALDIQNASTFDTFAWSDYSGNEDTLYTSFDVSLVETLMGVDLSTAEYWYFSVDGHPSEGLWYQSDYLVDGQWVDTQERRPATGSESQIVIDAIRAAFAEEFGGNVELSNAIDIGWIEVGANKEYTPWIWTEYQMPDLETAENFAKAAFSLSVKVNVPELQSAQVTTTVNRTALQGGSVLANVKWDGGDYSMAVNSENFDTAEVVDIRFFNSQGYELNIKTGLNEERDVSNVTGQALLNGEQVGTIEFRDGYPVIVYPNGDEETFESLF